MNYQNIYNKIILRGKDRVLTGYTEIHHILPKCLGGDNSADNLVELTAEEHFVVHQLLVRMYPTVRGLIYAAIRMTGKGAYNRKTNNKLYGWLKQRRSAVGQSEEHKLKNSIANSGVKNHMYGKARPEEVKTKLRNANIGKIMPDEVKEKISSTLKGRIVSQSTREKLGKVHKGKVTSEETKRKISETKRMNRLKKEEAPNGLLL